MRSLCLDSSQHTDLLDHKAHYHIHGGLLLGPMPSYLNTLQNV